MDKSEYSHQFKTPHCSQSSGGHDLDTSGTSGTSDHVDNICVTPKNPVMVHPHPRIGEIKGKFSGFPGSPLQIPSSPMMTRLGYGTGVGVYVLERSPRKGLDRSPWAIKKIATLRDSAGVKRDDSVYQKRLAHEANILKTLDHPNIIGYRAFSSITGSNKSSYLAMEKASKSLADLIESRFTDLENESVEDFQNECYNPYPAKDIEKVVLDIGNALNYLHFEKKYIHGDLKSGNILIFGEFEKAKLCDFGVSRKIKDNGKIDGHYVGTEIWNPMEVIMQKRGKKDKDITHKADIYPLGLVIYEMISLRPPHFPEDSIQETSINTSTNTNGSESDNFDEAAFDKALEENVGTRPPLPDIEYDESYNQILEVFYCCTEENPYLRPDGKDIVSLLSKEKQENE